jgi:hypothetical protein
MARRAGVVVTRWSGGKRQTASTSPRQEPSEDILIRSVLMVTSHHALRPYYERRTEEVVSSHLVGVRRALGLEAARDECEPGIRSAAGF